MAASRTAASRNIDCSAPSSSSNAFRSCGTPAHDAQPANVHVCCCSHQTCSSAFSLLPCLLPVQKSTSNDHAHLFRDQVGTAAPQVTAQNIYAIQRLPACLHLERRALQRRPAGPQVTANDVVALTDKKGWGSLECQQASEYASAPSPASTLAMFRYVSLMPAASELVIQSPLVPGSSRDAWDSGPARGCAARQTPLVSPRAVASFLAAVAPFPPCSDKICRSLPPMTLSSSFYLSLVV